MTSRGKTTPQGETARRRDEDLKSVARTGTDSTIIEDPKIPLVGNGSFQMYTIDSTEKTRSSKSKARSKMDNVGYRLSKRKELFKKRQKVSDLALFFALVGIVLAVIHVELGHGTDDKMRLASLGVKFTITTTTVALIGMLVYYHALDIRLWQIDNTVDDWRLAVTWRRVAKIVVEVLICGLHPPPGDLDYYNVEVHGDKPMRMSKVPVDVMLTLPMFLRLYLLARVLMLHSRLFTDASSQSIGALNRINFNFRFVFKSIMSMYPEYMLTGMILAGFLIAAWAMHACEMYHDEAHRNFLNSMWLIAITYMSVGYGDIVPMSYCGRTIAVLTGIFGAFCTALIIAVLTRNLELSRAEKYVHNFVLDVHLDKRQKHASANILKAGWFIYKHRKLEKQHKSLAMRTGTFKHQRKLFNAIHEMREVKAKRRRLVDQSYSLVEIGKCTSEVHDKLRDVESQQGDIDSKISEVKNQMGSIERKLEMVCATICQQDK